MGVSKSFTDMKNKIVESYRNLYGQEPTWIVLSPGRVSLIGGHTDYNHGFVLPMAIDQAIWMAFSPLKSREVRLYSVDFEQDAKITLDELKPGDMGWIEYVK